MSKRIILRAIFILFVVVGVFLLANCFKLIYEFKSNIVEFTSQTELKVEPENGIYDLFIMSSKSDTNESTSMISISKSFLASKDILSQFVIRTKEGIVIPMSKKESDVTYTIFDNVYKNIGYFEIDRKQTIKIESNSKGSQFERFAYAKEGSFVRFLDIIKYGLLFLLSVGAALVSGISLLILKRNRSSIANIGE